ncbi:MAG: hypothetical protein RLZZ01_2076, partial [Actinomycetota bacterium]
MTVDRTDMTSGSTDTNRAPGDPVTDHRI